MQVQAFRFGGQAVRVSNIKLTEGHKVALSVQEAGGHDFACVLVTPDEALALAAALERAAFIARRASSVGAEQAEAETGFRPMSPAAMAASGSPTFRGGLFGSIYRTSEG